MVSKQSDDILEEREEEISSFLEEIKEVKEIRSNRGRSYSLAEIFLLVLCAQLCGFESLREYEMYGEMKLALLRKFLPYKKGYPSKSTIARVLSLFKPKCIEMVLVKWMERIVSSSEGQKQIAIDGKRHRGAQTGEEEGLHLVSAYGVESGLVLAQEKVANKSNEIRAIPELLEALHIKGQIVTIDAMGCQKEIAKKIIAKKADYILALKGNQGQLHKDIVLYFNHASHLKKCAQYEDVDKGHGRFETRRCYVTDKIDWLDNKEEWAGLKSIVAVESISISKGQKTQETRYFISSLPPDPKLSLRSVRAHWGIEAMHWCLDVIFREDDRVIWNRNFAQNESIIRRLALNFLKKFQEICHYRIGNAKVALKTLRKILIGSDSDMEKLIMAAF